MEQLFRKKTEVFSDAVTIDGRWNIQDELLFQVFGLTLYGYAFNVGRLLCFLDTMAIHTFAGISLNTGLKPSLIRIK